MPPCQRFQAHAQLHQRKWFDQIVIGANIEAGDLVGEQVLGGQHQNGRVQGQLATQTPAQFQSIHAGQHQVQHDHIVGIAARLVQALQPIAGMRDGIAATGKVVADVLGDVVMIFNKQDTH
jgi:hypothetical protein